MTDEEIRERNQQILDELQEERLFLSGHHIRIDFGRRGYTHDDMPSVTWGDGDALRAHLPNYRESYEMPFLPSGIKFIDTTPTISEVLNLVRKVETKMFAIENPSCDYLEYSSSGVWDEGIGLSFGKAKGGNKWDFELCWTAVFVVEGGSEGNWLHVESIGRDKPPQPLLLGKALSASWEDCYRSAGRIAWMLNA